MKNKKILLLFESWVVGMVVVVVHFLLHLQHFFIGLILGIINTFFTEPFTKTVDINQHEMKMTNKKLLISTIKNIGISLSISLAIRGIDYVLLVNKIVDIPIEPFRFIIFYQIIYYGFKYLFIFIKNKFRKGEYNE